MIDEKLKKRDKKVKKINVPRNDMGTCSICGNLRVIVKSADIVICRKCYKTHPDKDKKDVNSNIDFSGLKRDYEYGLSKPALAIKYKCGQDLIAKHLKKVDCKIRQVGSQELNIVNSANRQGIELKDWNGYAKEKPYCEKFNEGCRASNRDKYDNKCFVCNKTKEENNDRRLSVHHVSKNKMEGCDGSKWQLIPTCMSCHRKAHHEPLQSRINYLLND